MFKSDINFNQTSQEQARVEGETRVYLSYLVGEAEGRMEYSKGDQSAVELISGSLVETLQ